jgi:pimeloyl-ACP methyl ester carboxylesterase
VQTMVLSEFFTKSKVRLRQRSQNPGVLNWLFLPGGPGIGAESLEELVETAALPGRSWLVDLPGDGSNLVENDPFRQWPWVLLISSAPDARWYSHYLRMTTQNPLPAMQTATQAFNANKSNETLRDLAVASAPWNFCTDALPLGEALLARMPYNLAAVEWSDRHFDHTFELKWWPTDLPTLILSGSQDRIVEQSFWDNARFEGKNVMWLTVEDGGHFPWIEKPIAVRKAFAAFVAKLDATS